MNNLDQSVNCHGITEQYSSNTDIELCVEEIKTQGFSVLSGDFSEEKLSYLRKLTDELYKKQCALLGGEKNLLKINDANIVRGPCGDNEIFIDIAMDERVHQVAKFLLGENFILYSQNAIINVPLTNHYQFTWHRDLNYQHWTSSRTLALSALLCLDPFNPITGGTYIIPASHKIEKFPSNRFVLKNQFCVTATPGDWILFDSMLFHRTGRNESLDKRRAVNHIIVPPFMAQQYDFSSMLSGKLKTDKQRIFFGEGRKTANSALEWRRRRIDSGFVGA